MAYGLHKTGTLNALARERAENEKNGFRFRRVQIHLRLELIIQLRYSSNHRP